MLKDLFGGKKDDEQKQVGEAMQNLSDQIGALQRQLNEKNAEIEKIKQTASGSEANAAGLDQAQKEMKELKQQLLSLQGSLAAAEAEKMASELIQQNKQKEIDELKAKLASAPAAAPAASPSATPAAAGGLKAGGSAWVTREGGLPLRLRSGASLKGKILDRLAPGTQITLLDGPQQADNHAWWHVRTADGKEGWVAGEDLRTQPD
jgi:SH3 domain-containing protein